MLGDIGRRVPPIGHHRHRRAQLGARHHTRPAARAATGTRGGEPGHGALPDQIAFELGEGGEDAEHQSPGGTGRVDAARQHLEADSLRL